MSESTAVTIIPEATVELGTIRATNPAALVAHATEAANALAGVIEHQKLYSVIQGKKFVRCEGWTTLAAMMGCLPREVSVVKDAEGNYEATVELARMSDGAILTRASAECNTDEKSWGNRDAYARRSMAITRATSKACRIAFSWIMVLSGFQPTPAEEVPPEQDEHPSEAKRQTSGTERTPQAKGHTAPSVPAAGPVTLKSVVFWGKHKGKTVKDVGPSYFEWLMGEAKTANQLDSERARFAAGALKALMPDMTTLPKALAPDEDDLAMDLRLAQADAAKAGAR